MGLVVFVSLCCVLFLHSEKNPVYGNISSAPEEEYIWDAPKLGAAVDHYIVQVLVNDVDILTIDNVLTERVMVTVVYGNKYMVRVAAVSERGIQGPFSGWSIPFTPELSPPEF
jgi:hypothetical protein